MTDISSITGGGGSQMFSNTNDVGNISQQDFLMLLIAQLRHQDPMEPADSQEFASQLAQFTSLEELQQLNRTSTQGVETNLMLSQTINNTMAATMIGKEVKAMGDTVILEHGAEPPISFQTGGFADDVDISIRDAAGNVVDTISMQSVAKGDHTVTWDAIGNNGNALPPGEYTFSVEATNAAGETIASDTVMIGLIEAVRYTNAGAIFIVNGEEIPFSSVLELGEPEPEDLG
ncbi:MAG: DUF2271 domain-containing protein [Candidatus Marinimicrobia bacterium]|nr:DUF2271 domain-containing protein [Candidatus Neomarinimicrobiota bacterium]